MRELAAGLIGRFPACNPDSAGRNGHPGALAPMMALLRSRFRSTSGSTRKAPWTRCFGPVFARANIQVCLCVYGGALPIGRRITVAALPKTANLIIFYFLFYFYIPGSRRPTPAPNLYRVLPHPASPPIRPKLNQRDGPSPEPPRRSGLR